jgi:cytochrome c oxidase cbb3-type subunit 3
MNTIKFKLIALVLGTLGTVPVWAQAASTVAAATEPAKKASPYQDPVFYLLATLVVILLAFIINLQRVLIGVAQSKVRNEKKTAIEKTVSVVLLLIVLGSIPQQALAAATDAKEQVPFLHHGFGSNAINALAALVVIELCVILYYVRMIRLFTDKQEVEVYAEETQLAEAKPSFWEKFNASVAVEKEAAIMTDHDYDGIRELDNSLPPWWKYGFYLTIVWACVYLVHFHVTKGGPDSLAEYNNQLVQAEADLAEYRKKAANLVDETNVKLLTDASEISKGKEIFEKNCTTCHGPQAQGAQVGPNLTDDYWLHGGDVKDVFKTIKFGVQGKGMKSWKNDLTPSMIAEVTSYIKSLHGSNPANAKAPDGTLWTESGTAPSSLDTLKKPNTPDTTLQAVATESK